MRTHLIALLPLLLAAAPERPALAADGAGEQPWGYQAGVLRPRQQGSYCARREDALEIAGIFRRFGARTGFSALTHAPGCSQRVHGVTPLTLLETVRIDTQSGHYSVNFITVRVEDGSQAVLITTRRFLED